MPRSAEAKKRRNALRRARFAEGPRGPTRKPPLPGGRPDPRHFQTIDPDTYSFPGYFTAELLQTTCPWEETASLSRREGHQPSTTLPPDPEPEQEQVAPALCTTCPTAGPQESIDEEELILSSWKNKLVLRWPPPIPVTRAQQFDQEIFRLQGLPAKEVKYIAIQYPELYKYARARQSWKPCILSGPGVEAFVYWRNPRRAAPTLVTRTA